MYIHIFFYYSVYIYIHIYTEYVAFMGFIGHHVRRVAQRSAVRPQPGQQMADPASASGGPWDAGRIMGLSK